MSNYENANPQIIISLLFALSLFGAVILFAVLKSTAMIKTPKYQAGGALAGFILIFGILAYTYYKVEDIASLQAQINRLQGYVKPKEISGVVAVDPADTKVILAVAMSDISATKRFQIKAPCVDQQKGLYTLYVIQEGRSYSYDVQPNDKLSEITIPAPGGD
jgi:hypothetical protein